ncbi:5'-methylthioadenosine/adenosylhomocysteine nucleosidase [Apilactobacillus xinyiensis]|uniref:adenosylhomocysteine nucleosidase n=1 Tax=Apilactobacillus xinyiensis TaxID=2841032 RepID=A0ABT0I1Z5_9LACO|nr:5'-methylthioadenosine/adenosylhomocysteine nucleosidase [Apilactobacillus xinyiensis]MCK8624740.1 5'-methylthioadenosine/adenosylhomocysteine nucleosidase [Apilactobacillus xinyiensis]MCL0318855.1 5'-methylthioadenosine/adenosylhomocysteine nucleosidase [Apilactobacillus xinyiensis]
MKFGILCAMDEEIKTLIDNLDNKKEVNIKGIIFYEGTIFNQSVVLVKSGIGKVEAGLSTALLITKFNADVVINSGSAGGIGDGLSVGDVVVSTETAYHDADARAAGYEYGQLPGQPSRFQASEKWSKQIIDASKDVGLHTKTGLIVSGDQFVADKDTIKHILKYFPDALSCEMEGAAVGQVANQFETPYVVVRAMSDVGDENADTSFNEFIIEAGKRSAQMLLDLFKNQ